MRSVFKPLVLVAALISGGMVVAAQPDAATGQQHTHMARHGGMDMAKMQERMASRMADLKAKLAVTAAQEPAWANFVAAMQPPADMAQHMGRENRTDMRKEMQSMTTPQRIDRMNAMKAQRDAHMTARNDATLALYIALTPEQQKVFDDNTMRGREGMGGHSGGGKGRHHG
jgi:periplasmic protein CpxP/Spy